MTTKQSLAMFCECWAASRVAMNERDAARPQVYRFGSNRLYLFGAIATVSSYTLEGPLRYALQLAHAGSLLYIRDVIAVSLVALVAMSWLAGQVSAAPLVTVLAILLAHTLVGLVSLPTAMQALFGFKIFLPFLLGFVVAPVLLYYKPGFVRVSAAVFAITAVGVAFNSRLEFPWIGADYETAFGTTSIAKQWWVTGSVQRLPGFARASFTAAVLMMVSIVPLMASRASVLTKVGLLGLAGWIVALTTSKGPLLSLVVLSLDAVVAYGLRAVRLANMLLIVLAFLCLGVPLMAVQIAFVPQSMPNWLGSFMERVTEMWPEAFALFDHPGQVLWGRGLGGIGTAQSFGELAKINTGDNLMVYLLVAFGIIGVLYVGLFLLRLLQYLQTIPRTDLMFQCMRGWTIVWLAYGVVANMIEEASVNLAMGIVFGVAFGARTHVRCAAKSVAVTTRYRVDGNPRAKVFASPPGL